MIFNKVIGNLRDFEVDKGIELIPLRWDELEKRIFRKTTDKGREVGIALEQAQCLRHGDVLYNGSEGIIAIEVLTSKAIVLEPSGMWEMAQVCYQLGNRHARVFFEGEEILIPFDQTIVDLFKKLSFSVTIEERRLVYALQSTPGHHH